MPIHGSVEPRSGAAPFAGVRGPATSCHLLRICPDGIVAVIPLPSSGRMNRPAQWSQRADQLAPLAGTQPDSALDSLAEDLEPYGRIAAVFGPDGRRLGSKKPVPGNGPAQRPEQIAATDGRTSGTPRRRKCSKSVATLICSSA